MAIYSKLWFDVMDSTLANLEKKDAKIDALNSKKVAKFIY